MRIATIIISILIIYFVGSWIVNGVQFFKSDFDAPYKKEFVKGVGLFGFSPITVWVANDEK